MRHTALVRIAKLVDDDVWNNPEAVWPARELFLPRALQLRPDYLGEVPVRIDHIKDGSQDIGRVLDLGEFDELDGRWCVAHVEIDKPPVWLRRGTPHR
jgi:hypothetical protein